MTPPPPGDASVTMTWEWGPLQLRAEFPAGRISLGAEQLFREFRVSPSRKGELLVSIVPVSGGFALHPPAPGLPPVVASESEALEALEFALANRLGRGRIRELLSLHAAGVVIEGRGMLLVGSGGAGKSTLAVGCAQSGDPVLGDDLVPIRLEDARAIAFPRLLKLEEPAASLLGLPGPRGPFAPDAPWAAFLHPEELGSRWAEGEVPIAAILFPAFEAGAATAWEPLEPEQGLQLLLNHRVFPATDEAADFDLLARLVGGCSLVGALRFSTPGEGVSCIRSLLSSLARCPSLRNEPTRSE